jgi:hypothetical protein
VLKLPKDVLSDPRHDELATLLSANEAPLWDGGRSPVATLAMTDALAVELRAALRAQHACQGLELIADKLAAEQKGLDAVNKKAPDNPQNARVSRVLFLANDGSPRFYRDCDALLSRYAHRVLGCRLDIAGEALGEALLGTSRMVRSALVFDKGAAAKALLALLPPSRI